MARGSKLLGVRNPAALVSVAALVACFLTLRGTYVLQHSEHAVAVHVNGGLPPWAKSRGAPRHPDDGANGAPSHRGKRLRADVWAGGRVSTGRDQRDQLRAMLNATEQKQLMELCGRCLWHTLTEFAVAHGGGHAVHVPTGDIPDMW